MASDFYSALAATADATWASIIGTLQSDIHPVDRNATRIWFAFYPVKLARAFASTEDAEALRKKLIIKGQPSLSAMADSAPEFLFGHRYWPKVKAAVSEYAAQADGATPLAQHIKTAAQQIAKQVNATEALTLGITAVAFGTLQQVGADVFKQAAAAGDYGKHWNKSADQIVADRAKDDGQGVFGFLKTVDKSFSVNFRECEPGHTFKVINMQDVAMAAKETGKPYNLRDERYKEGEGPIPVECRTAACGTCWVGVLSPTEKLSPPTDRELDKWKYFGYEGFTGTADSPIRLACQLKAYGNVTITIPAWCGMIGKLDEAETKAAKA